VAAGFGLTASNKASIVICLLDFGLLEKILRRTLMFRKMCFGIVAVAVLAPAVWGQTADEIIAKNIQARGGLDKLKSVQSMKATATMAMGPGMEAPGVLIQKRGNLARLEFTIQGLTAVQAYDGKNAWQVMPFTGKKDPELMSADEAKEVEEMADIDGPMVDYKSKGNQVEFLGKEKVEGTDAYKLKVSLKNGDVQTVYIDADSFLEIKEETKRMVRGSEQVFESSIGDYKDVNGIIFPFAEESGVKGSEQKEKLTITKIELNVPTDDSIFRMPQPAPAPEPAKTDAPKK
jgi:outer membrane lipoprotein-sorting protein